MSTVTVRNLRCEYGKNPIGIDQTPRFSWVIDANKRGAGQQGYRLRVCLKEGEACLWDSGEVKSSQSVNVRYEGETLESSTAYRGTLQVQDLAGAWTEPEEATFETGILDPALWKATWICGGNLLRKEFCLKKAVKESRVYISGLGYYELRMNGQKVGDHVLDPAWTDFEQKAFYATYDVTDLLRTGGNAIGVMLGNGRYSPNDSTVAKNWHPLKKYGPSPVLFFQQLIRYTDGTQELVLSDLSWKAAEGPVVFNDIYDGEHYDATREQPGWDCPDFDDSQWAPAQTVQEHMGRLVSQGTMPVIRVMKPRTAISMTQPAKDTYLYDFGQNFAGWVRLKVKGYPGCKIQLHFAELKNKKTGMLNPNTNRGAEATDIYICRGYEEEIFEPHFTYHGFRYVELTGYPGTPSIDSVEARVVHSSVERIGSFSCGNELINRIHSNYIWTQVSNLHSVPTDCCQRDERMGWVGDAQLSAEAAVYNFDMASFYTKFEADIRESQLETGSVAGVSPAYWSCYPADPTYATACVEFPWIVSRYYDDDQIIRQSLNAMTRWVDYLGSQADENGIVSFGLFGDWCPPMHANPVDTPFEITSTWYYAHDAYVVSQMAKRVGEQKIADKYYAVYEKAAQAFNRQYLKGDRYSASKFSDEELAEKIKSWLNVLPPEQRPAVMKRYATLYSSSSQTSNLLPLYLGMVPEKNEAEVLQTLIQDLEATRSWHINTGVVGLKFLPDVLIQYGYEDLAFKLMTQDTFPSFGYQILKEDATTLWERWEFLDSDKVFNSHSHPFAGSIDVYFYKTLAGIGLEGDHPGFSSFTLKPVMSGDLPYASAYVDTIRGRISSSWSRSENSLDYAIEVPGNTAADLAIPKNKWQKVRITEGDSLLWDGTAADSVEGLKFVSEDDKYVYFRTEAGKYSFRVVPV